MPLSLVGLVKQHTKNGAFIQCVPIHRFQGRTGEPCLFICHTDFEYNDNVVMQREGRFRVIVPARPSMSKTIMERFPSLFCPLVKTGVSVCNVDSTCSNADSACTKTSPVSVYFPFAQGIVYSGVCGGCDALLKPSADTASLNLGAHNSP